MEQFLRVPTAPGVALCYLVYVCMYVCMYLQKAGDDEAGFGLGEEREQMIIDASLWGL